MSTYSVGEATKERIIAVCKELFYEKGLRGTSYNDICDKADINRGLLPYHFKSKNNIAKIVFSEFIEDFEAISKKTIVTDNFNVYFAIALFLLFDLISKNHNLRRFYSEIETEERFISSTMMLQEDIINQILAANQLHFENDELRTIICMFEGVETEIIRNMHNGYITEPVEKVVVRDIYFVFSQLGFERTQIDMIIKEAKAIFNKYEMRMGESFTLELIKR